MTGMHIHPSGTPVFARSDVGGAYQDCVYRSNNAGDHWIRTNLSPMAMKPNDDASKLSGERLSVDPVNADIVYFGSINDGLWHTRDSGKNWSRIDAVPKGAKDHGIRQILFDGLTRDDRQSRRLLAMVDGEGVFESTDAGETWRNTNLDIVNPSFYDAEISKTGILFVCGVDAQGRTMHVRRYDVAKVMHADAWSSVRRLRRQWMRLLRRHRRNEEVAILLCRCLFASTRGQCIEYDVDCHGKRALL